MTEKDMVNHPSHYTQYSQEVIDTIMEWITPSNDPIIGYLIGTSLKYLARFNFKGKPLEDLEKSNFYLTKAIEHLRKRKDSCDVANNLTENCWHEITNSNK
ncbi:DUF3310 domain-containing protein [Aerococcaceae bacterium zg-B36]|uniref:DUF3310 domain-containing protein n=1 Tax=Aerococcaceae bacterium zg-252 TaxID=2796928 RepID=UPI001BD8F6DE|nr:DUF3310 domain-containing protein [Aerococcaceae bacterium zg-B36]